MHIYMRILYSVGKASNVISNYLQASDVANPSSYIYVFPKTNHF